MTRNWDAEWQQLSKAQDKAFPELRNTMTVVTGMSLGEGGPSEEQMDQAETARKAWEDSMRQLNVWLAAANLTPILACSPGGYVKTGVTDEEYRRDIEECAELAQHEARRDFATRRARLPSFARTRHDVVGLRRVVPLSSEAELEHRYRRICMLARDYELAPLDE